MATSGVTLTNLTFRAIVATWTNICLLSKVGCGHVSPFTAEVAGTAHSVGPGESILVTHVTASAGQTVA